MLAIERVGREDDFFAQGGDSLKAIQLSGQLSRALGRDVPLMAVFDNPTVGRLAAALDAAPARLASAGSPADGGGPPEVPLSYAQARLWFLNELEPDSPAYNAPAVWALRGALDVAALGRALTGLARRHAMLRTSVALVDGQPVLRTAPDAAVDLVELLAAGEGGTEERRAEARRVAVSLVAAPWPLTGPPLLRAWLIRAAPGEHVLMLGLHHAVCDGGSRSVLGRDLAGLYAAERGQGEVAPSLLAEYRDHVRLQQRRVSDGELEADLQYWRERLRGLQGELPILPDHVRPPRPSRRGARHGVRFDGDLLRALGLPCVEHRATPFMALLASFAALLRRWGAGDDIAVGSPVLGRSRPEFDRVVGHFANTIVLRLRLPAEPTFEQVLGHVREVALGAYAHQELPFERLVRELEPARDLSSNPLFQVLFAVQPAAEAMDAAGVRMEPITLDVPTAKMDLTVWLELGAGGVDGYVEHSLDLFDPGTVRRLVEHWHVLLRAMAADPGARVGDVDLVSEADRRAFDEWNRTERPWQPACIHRLFEAQAARTPHAPAVVTADSELTYRDLDRWAGSVARRLIEAGVGPEVVVGVCLRRHAGLVAALLGVLKAGAAYVPLDPALPEERLRSMLEDAGAAMVVTEPALAHAVPGAPARLVLIGEPPGAGDPLPPVAAAVTPENLAYVIYTSGSTGRPKGVAIEHRSASAMIAWSGEVFSPDELAGTLAATSASFDVSIFEIFSPLAMGGTVLLCESLLDLHGVPWPERIRIVCGVPAMVRALLADGPLPSSVTTVALGGEPLHVSTVEELYRGPGVARVLNMYGPAEDTTYTTFELAMRSGRSPGIGRPVANERVHILDARLRPVPPGVPGEIHIAGTGLARGYRGSGALTAGRFLPDPFGADGGRMYATGDIGRYLADGRIQCLGRTDAQVKVNGIRVEPAEVESVLLDVPGIREAAVVAAGAVGARRLVACVAWGPDADGPRPELRGHLARHLPGAFVPSIILELEHLPRTSSGKVDRPALRALVERGPGLDEPPAVWPRTATEELLARIWSEVLDRRPIAVHDDFFHLGGHSLLATQVVARMRTALGVEVPVSILFEASTIAALAERVELAMAGAMSVPAPGVRPVDRDRYRVRGEDAGAGGRREDGTRV